MSIYRHLVIVGFTTRSTLNFELVQIGIVWRICRFQISDAVSNVSVAGDAGTAHEQTRPVRQSMQAQASRQPVATKANLQLPLK